MVRNLLNMYQTFKPSRELWGGGGKTPEKKVWGFLPRSGRASKDGCCLIKKCKIPRIIHLETRYTIDARGGCLM